MAHGGVAPVKAYSAGDAPPGRFTWWSFLVCIIAGSGGLLFGYDLGVTGGVTGMPSFLKKFYPGVIAAKEAAAANNHSAYCVFDDAQLQLWTSSMFLAGAVAGLLVIVLANRNAMKCPISRKYVMVLGGSCFFFGALIQCLAEDVAMLYIGRILLGFGIGFANQSVPLYISEMAPPAHRGQFNILFQLCTTVGIFGASLINYGVDKSGMEWGWRLSIGLAMVPAAFFFIGALCCPDTPTSMLYRNPNNEEKARQVLRAMRGVEDVSIELQEIIQNAQEARNDSLLGSAKALYSKAHYKQAMAACLIPFFQQFTGMNAIMFYAPQIFQVLGLSVQVSLVNSVVTNTVNLLATFIAILIVDWFGRKVLFFGAGALMGAMQIVTGVLIEVYFNKGSMPHTAGVALIVCICLFVSGFACSWGPLGWLVPSEIHTAQTRTAGQASTVFVNFLASFLIGQFFNSMLCKMEWGVFLFFAAWVIIMTSYVAVMLPETKGLTLESMMAAWATIPNWRFWKTPEIAAAGTDPKVTDNGAPRV